METSGSNRRDVASRNAGAARAFAAWLAARGVSPNAISLASIGFAGLGAWGLLQGTAAGWIGALLCIQARLLCNLFDGMVAVEHGRATPAGALYNEFPDRVADSLLLVAFGYAVGTPWLGWLAALLAALTAYVRVFGGALGQAQSFKGPMAKQHRMAVMSVALVLMAGAPVLGIDPARIGVPALAFIAAGSALTCITRTRHIARGLRAADTER